MVTEKLLFFELDTAILAMININWHDCFSLAEFFQLPNLAGHYSAPARERQGQEDDVYRFLIVSLYLECYTAKYETIRTYMPFSGIYLRLLTYTGLHGYAQYQFLPVRPLYW